MVLTVTKKVRKVKEEIVDLFPRPVFSSQIPPPPVAWTISGTLGVAVSGHKLLGDREKFLGGLAPKKPNPSHRQKAQSLSKKSYKN
jgi:hypothetical protein